VDRDELLAFIAALAVFATLVFTGFGFGVFDPDQLRAYVRGE